MNKELSCKWPVSVLMSSQFLPVNCAQLFGFGDGAQASYDRMMEKFSETIPDSANNLQGVTIANSSHMDQGDICMYDQYVGTTFNSMIFKCDATKSQGTPIEFHEFLACTWLEYLFKIGYHDNTFTMKNLFMRLK